MITSRDRHQDDEAREYVMPLRYLSAPVVVAELPGGVRHWSEYRHEQIRDRGRELDAIAYLQAASGTVGEVTE